MTWIDNVMSKALGGFTKDNEWCKFCNGRKKIDGKTCPKCNGWGKILK